MESNRSSSQNSKSSGNSGARGSGGQPNSGSVDEGAIANAKAEPEHRAAEPPAPGNGPAERDAG